ncbi:GNAT family N-acetyltransferase [Streptomyces sp. MST-110588]|uniref:GNAT family N-acetyltransferase n=1 Tax=Streptomyces sp. MST-110588 TaxID=2833628 RepID=UPI001F5CCCA0|nr:GNAT family N-acetyltransferase [Streptomyces sp. MST-110588]UNO39944.1 GNAT family N-acetyltransferase [Streptomyces sp. MST-110588]
MIFRTATRRDLPALLALLADEDAVTDPATVEVSRAHEQAFEDIDNDDRNELLVLAEDGSGDAHAGGRAEGGVTDGGVTDEGVTDEDGAVLGFLQITYIPGLGRGGGERALLEAVRIRADRRGAGLGRELIGAAIGRARRRGCSLVQLTSNKRRTEAHRFYASLGFERSHDGFKLALAEAP